MNAQTRMVFPALFDSFERLMLPKFLLQTLTHELPDIVKNNPMRFECSEQLVSLYFGAVRFSAVPAQFGQGKDRFGVWIHWKPRADFQMASISFLTDDEKGLSFVLWFTDCAQGHRAETQLPDSKNEPVYQLLMVVGPMILEELRGKVESPDQFALDAMRAKIDPLVSLWCQKKN